MSTDETGAVRKIAVVGLGYVGLPVAVAFARRFENTIGFDVDARKVEALRRGEDPSGAVDERDLRETSLHFTSDAEELRRADFFVVAVPTPIDHEHRPDLGALRKASELVGRALRPGAIVVYESTVYPGVTEEVCGPILEDASGLRSGEGFKLGYSPERINPGDPEHGFEQVVKVVSAQDAEALEVVSACYGAVVGAGLHRASSIKVAEAAKVIENTQRDLNIALTNELAIIFDRLDIDTNEVLDAAASKWNFIRFTPGLVGGHCIGVDPYYLTSKAEQVGIHPQVILAGRRINDGMGTFVAERTIKQLILAGRSISGARVAILGLTFKENVPDVRNSRVPSIVEELRSYGVEVVVHDPLADPEEARREYGLDLAAEGDIGRVDAVVLAVPHRGMDALVGRMLEVDPPAVVVDVKSVLDPSAIPSGVRLWRL
jgi:UDP-N-acetyl-D-galactosamine dehydrogenase